MKTIIEIRDEFNLQLNNIQIEKEKMLRPLYLENIRKNLDSLIGLNFPSDFLDDTFEIKQVEKEDCIIFTVFPSYDNSYEITFELLELNFVQLEEINSQLLDKD